MAIPKLKKQDIIDALNYIDEHGIPSQNESAKYKLVTNGFAGVCVALALRKSRRGGDAQHHT